MSFLLSFAVALIELSFSSCFFTAMTQLPCAEFLYIHLLKEERFWAQLKAQCNAWTNYIKDLEVVCFKTVTCRPCPGVRPRRFVPLYPCSVSRRSILVIGLKSTSHSRTQPSRPPVAKPSSQEYMLKIPACTHTHTQCSATPSRFSPVVYGWFQFW